MKTPKEDARVNSRNAEKRAQFARETRPFLTCKQVAYHLGVSLDTLRRMRRSKTGPRCRMHGATWVYHIDDLEAWSLAHAQGGDHD
ncbi:helix-turn-helix transcriptional regulator [Novosphingobium rosa]|uniref:helix-turn-helix transcriptional regulator n=1 Tax=Novosphingobium rosa TaxID=76978 RepID=UPI0008362A81|nr:helix-turn-helix domain-containing protein [Novosphingobium rosa]